MEAKNVALAAELIKERDAIIKKISAAENPNSTLKIECGSGGYITHPGPGYRPMVKSPKVESIIKAILAAELKEMLADVERHMKEIGLEI